MFNNRLYTVLFFIGTILAVSPVLAANNGDGKIVCWKNKDGKIVGCGDSVPTEYLDNASTELDRQGMTIKRTGAALTPAQKKALAEELARQQEEQRKQEEQNRKDKALLDTFTTPDEIDLKRDRDLQLAESNLEILEANLKNTQNRLADLQAHAANYTRTNKTVPQTLQDEIDEITMEKNDGARLTSAKQQEIVDIKQRYSELKQRFIQLTGGAAQGGK